jgi:Uma2 family endonuclease
MAAPMTRWMTVEQFASDSALEHGYYLIDGEVKTDMGTAHSLHEKLKAATARLLILSLRDDARAMVYVDTGFEFNPYTLLIPDVSVLWPDRPYVPRRHFQGSPEIAIEILSPVNTPSEYDQKAKRYWSQGAQAVWVVDPDKRCAYAISRTGEWMQTEAVLEVLLKSTTGQLLVTLDLQQLWPVLNR